MIKKCHANMIIYDKFYSMKIYYSVLITCNTVCINLEGMKIPLMMQDTRPEAAKQLYIK